MSLFSIYDLIRDVPPTLRVIDVGAMSIGQNMDSYNPLLRKGRVSIVGFEPVQSECDKLNALQDPARTYLPYAIGDGRVHTLNITNTLMTSSLYEPDAVLQDKFQNLENLTRVVERKQVQTRRLDDIPEVAGSDYIKVDVQGAEMDVFNGATNVLMDIVVVETEVEFIPLYQNQPLFAEVDQVLRRNGFVFHRFKNVASRMFKPLLRDKNPNMPGSQLLWADAVYIKNFMNLDSLSSEQLLKLAIILHEIYGSVDTCAFVLQEYERKTGDGLRERYFKSLLAL